MDKVKIVKKDINIKASNAKENLQEEKNLNVDNKQKNFQNDDINKKLDIKNNKKVEKQKEKEIEYKQNLDEVKNDTSKDKVNTNRDENKNEVFNLTIDSSKKFFKDEKEYYISYNKKSNKYNLFRDTGLKEKNDKIEELYNKYNKIAKDNIKDKTIFINYINTE